MASTDTDRIQAAVAALMDDGWNETHDGGTLTPEELANIARTVFESDPFSPVECVTGKPLAHDHYIVEELTKYLCLVAGEEYRSCGVPSSVGRREAARAFLGRLDESLARRAAAPCMWVGGTYETPTICDSPRMDLGRVPLCEAHVAALEAGERRLIWSREGVAFRLAAEREGRCTADPAAGFTGDCDGGPIKFRLVVSRPDGPQQRTGLMCRFHADQEDASCSALPDAYRHEVVSDVDVAEVK